MLTDMDMDPTDTVTLVAGESTIQVQWSLLERWSTWARMFRSDNPGESHRMVLTDAVDDGAAVRAFVRFGLRHQDREDGSPMDDGDALGAVSVAHLLNATVEWFIAANEGLRKAMVLGQTPASHEMWMYAFARDVGIARFLGKRLFLAWDALGHQVDADAETVWMAMKTANDAFTAHCKVDRNTLPTILGCDAYVRACIRSGHSDYLTSQPLPLAPFEVRPGSLLHAFCFDRKRPNAPIDPVYMQASIRREVNAGHLRESDYCQLLIRTLGVGKTTVSGLKDMYNLEKLVAHRRK